jgi:tRNA pseudouridine38-40 synthase
VRSGLFAGMYTRERRPLDVDCMQDAGQYLLGENDFSSFRASHCQSRTPMRNVHHLNVSTRGGLILIDIQANAFLHHMVRNIAGVLMDIGAGQKPVPWMQQLLALRDRTRASATAAPDGLYLVDVVYPGHSQIPKGPVLPHFMSLLDSPNE